MNTRTAAMVIDNKIVTTPSIIMQNPQMANPLSECAHRCNSRNPILRITL